MEKFLYEYRPHIYLVMAMATFVKLNDSMLALACGGMLAVCGFLVLRIRSEHRKRFF